MKLKSTIEYQTDLVCLKRSEFDELMKERELLAKEIESLTAERDSLSQAFNASHQRELSLECKIKDCVVCSAICGDCKNQAI